MSRQIGEVLTRVFSPGEIIFHEGDDPKGEAFIVHIGRVEIRKRIGGEDRLLRVLGKGDLLGELGLFGNTPRSASAVATDSVTLMVIPANRLDHLVRANFPETLLLARGPVAWGATAEVLTADNLLEARRMCEAFDDSAAACAVDDMPSRAA